MAARRLGKRALVLSNGAAGAENQAIGVAEALGLPYEVRCVEMTPAFARQPPQLHVALARLSRRPLLGYANGAAIAREAADARLIVGSGRATAALNCGLKQLQGDAAVCVQVQDPRLPLGLGLLDLVVTPQHDGLPAHPRRLQTVGSVHRVSAAALAQAASDFPTLHSHPGPRLGVLVGGDSPHYAFTLQRAAALAEQLQQYPGSVLLTTSRRTSPEVAALLEQRGGCALAYRPDSGSGPNPYLGILAVCDELLVTPDSVSMASEAASAGVPVRVFDADRVTGKLARFHAALQASGGQLRDMERVAEAVGGLL